MLSMNSDYRRNLCNRLGALLGVLLVTGLIVRVHAAAPQADTTGFHFLQEPLNPRAIGMGSAATAVAGRGFAHYNPALPGLMNHDHVAADYGLYPRADLTRGAFESARIGETWFGAATFNSFSVDDIVSADERGIKQDLPVSWQQSILSLAAGMRRGDIAAAVCVNGGQDRIKSSVSYALTASVGALAWLWPGKLSLGAAALHVGRSTPMLGGDTWETFGEGSELPLSGRGGVAWIDTLRGVGYTAACDVTYRRSDGRITVPVGIEVRPLPPLALRMGKRINHDTELLGFGMGLSAGPLAFDLGFSLPKLVSDVELKWLAGLTYRLRAGGPGKKKQTKSEAASGVDEAGKAGEEAVPQSTDEAEDNASADVDEDETGPVVPEQQEMEGDEEEGATPSGQEATPEAGGAEDPEEPSRDAPAGEEGEDGDAEVDGGAPETL